MPPLVLADSRFTTDSSLEYFSTNLQENFCFFTEPHMPIARQHLGKHIPDVALSTIGHPLLGN
jgi:hypothetical protein